MKQKLLYFLLVLCMFSVNATAQSYEKQYEKCSESLKNLKTVDSIYFVRAMERDSCLTGVEAPEFQATALDGEKIDYSKLRGQVIVLNFWFTRCGPCIAEMPGLNQLVDLYTGKKVAFISFTYDSANTVKNFLKDHTFKFMIVANNDSVRRDVFKLFSAWPYTIIIGKDGKIAYMGFGSKGENSFAFFNEKIKKLL